MRALFFLSSGTFTAPAILQRIAPLSFARLSNTVAVAVRDSGDVVLVDVGWSAEACADPARFLGRVRAASLGVRAKPGDAIVDQLRALGIEPSRVKTIVATHLHLDHIGGACDFPDAEVVCTDRELRAFRGLPRDFGYRAEDLAKTGRARSVILAGAPTYGFPASHDLFGDGEIILCDAQGHTPGLAAVALCTAKRTYVHVGDAVYQSWEYGLSPPGPSIVARFTAWRREELVKTYAAIRACEADARGPVVVPSHDLEVFEKLPQTPAAAS